jgi:hypothetical protein
MPEQARAQAASSGRSALITEDGDYALAPETPDQSSLEAEFSAALKEDEAARSSSDLDRAAASDVEFSGAAEEDLVDVTPTDEENVENGVKSIQSDLESAFSAESDADEAAETLVPAIVDAVEAVDADAADEPVEAARKGSLAALLAEVEAGDVDLDSGSVPVRVGSKLAALRPHRPAGNQPRSLWPAFATLTAVVLLVAGMIIGRGQVVLAVPQMAGLYDTLGFSVNLRGLEFRDLTTTQTIDRGSNLLVVEGVIANITQSRKQVPSVRLALVDSNQVEVSGWSVNPNTTTLDVSETVRFRTSVASPSQRATELVVRFLDR